jgi:hypothetical protein
MPQTPSTTEFFHRCTPKEIEEILQNLDLEALIVASSKENVLERQKQVPVSG